MDQSSTGSDELKLPTVMTRGEYDLALSRADEIFSARKGTVEGEELDTLIDAIVRYEDLHFPFETPRTE